MRHKKVIPVTEGSLETFRGQKFVQFVETFRYFHNFEMSQK